MCRKNQILGFLILAFGVGLLVGKSIDSVVLACCMGIGCILAGCLSLKKK